MIYYLSACLKKREKIPVGCLAQLGEHRLYTAEVGGSIPSASTIKVAKLPAGRVAKWLNAADCKSVTSGFGSSNLPPPTIKVYWGVAKR